MPKQSSAPPTPSKEASKSKHADAPSPQNIKEDQKKLTNPAPFLMADDLMSEDDENDKDYDPMCESEEDSELSQSDIDLDDVETVSQHEKDLLLSEAQTDIEQLLASNLEARKTITKKIQQLKSNTAGVELTASESETLDQLTKELDLVEKSLENITNRGHSGASSQ